MLNDQNCVGLRNVLQPLKGNFVQKTLTAKNINKLHLVEFRANNKNGNG